MIRALVLLSLIGCGGDETAQLGIVVEDGRYLVELQRPADHEWGTTSATANGQELVLRARYVGTDDPNDHSDYAFPSYARYCVPLTVDAPTELAVIEDGDRFSMVVTDLVTERALALPDLAGEIDAHASFDVRSNVPSDHFTNAHVAMFSATEACRVAFPEGDGAVHVDLLADWRCPLPAAGTTMTYDYVLDFVDLEGAVAACTGPKLACLGPKVGPASELTGTTTLRF